MKTALPTLERSQTAIAFLLLGAFAPFSVRFYTCTGT